MSQLWTFSPSSEPYLQRCIEAALLQDRDNKWTQKFGRKTSKNLNISSNSEEIPPVEVVVINSPDEKLKEPDSPVSYDEFIETLENEIRLDHVVLECSNNQDLLVKMAENLTPSTVDKLFNLIFSSDTISKEFLNCFILLFLPHYIKQKNRLNIDILIRISEDYPEILQKLFEILLKDTEIPNELLNNYISSINNEKCTTFLENLCNFEMPAESFIQKVISIEMAYTNCIKTQKVQNYIKNCLITYKNSCINNKNYGKLFMTYLKAEKSSDYKINIKQIKDCLEIHRSPFKRPCLLLLKEFDNE